MTTTAAAPFELTFEPEKHIYKLNGKRLTSVTTVLGAGIAKPQLIDWAARTAADFAVANPGASWEAIAKAHKDQRDKAAVRGTAVHNLAEALNNGEAVEVPEELDPYIDGYIRFLDDFQVTVILAEQTVFLSKFGVAGRFDLIARSPYLCGGDPFIADIKTSSGVYRETAAQLAAYGLADGYVTAEDPHTLRPLPRVEGSFVLHCTPEGTDVHPFAENRVYLRDDFHYFEAAHAIYKRTLAAHKVKDPIPYPTHTTIGSAA
jgi:hypothetical protein